MTKLPELTQGYNELRLIKSLDELQKGMVVVINACRKCGEDHTSRVIGFHPAVSGNYSGDVLSQARIVNGWEIEPSACRPAFTRELLTQEIVDERRLYRLTLLT